MNAILACHSGAGGNPGGFFAQLFALMRCADYALSSSAISPCGDLLFFASPKKSKQKKGDPIRWCLRHSPAMLGSKGRCGTRSHKAARSDNPRAQLPLSLRFSAPPTGPNSTSPATETSTATATAGACFARAASALAFDVGPLGRPRAREHHRAVRSTAVSGCAFLWLLSFAQAKESNSPKGETTLKENTKPAERVSAIQQNKNLDSRLRGNDLLPRGVLAP